MVPEGKNCAAFSAQNLSDYVSHLRGSCYVGQFEQDVEVTAW